MQMTANLLQKVDVQATAKMTSFRDELKPKFHVARHVSIRHDSTRRTCRVMSRRDEPSGIWAFESTADNSSCVIAGHGRITGARSSTSVNGDIAIQWEWSNFDSSQNQNPLTDYDKTLHN